MKVIGITGKAGSGKDTVAGHLIGKYGYIRGQFAFDLKRMVCETFGWETDRLDDLEYKEEIPLNSNGTPQCPGPPGAYPNGMSRRDVLIFWGTNCMREIDPDIHVKLTLWRLERRVAQRHFADPDRRRGQLVFADLRFLNEEAAVRRLGGIILRTVKLGGPGTSSGGVSETEMDLINPDFTVEAAHGEIPFLLEQVDDILCR